MIIPVVIAAITLGVSFDLGTVKPGNIYIYEPKSIAENMQKIPKTFTSAQYRLVETSSETNDFLSMGGGLSLLAKSGKVTLRGVGKYLIESINRENTVELLVSVFHESQTDTFSSFVKQRDDWQALSPKKVGSHYIRSITYGGQLLISYKMEATKAEYMEEIKAAVSGSIQASGSLDAAVAGRLEKLNKNLAGKFRYTISAFATTGLFKTPKNLEGILRLIKEYPQLVKEVDNGKGRPVRMELMPISSLRPEWKEYRRNFAMESIFEQATNKYEDLKIADTEFKDWEKKELWNDKQQKLINDYNKSLKLALLSLKTAISDLDLSQNVSLNHFDEAFKVYGEGKDNIPNRYMRNLRRLIHEVENIPFYWFPFTRSVTHYVHWGSVNCSSRSSEALYVGYAVSSPKGFGNGGNIMCLSTEPSLGGTESSNATISTLNGLTYMTPNYTDGYAYCAQCKLENATSVITVAGRTNCPEDMKFEYSGYLATNQKTTSPLICMDDNPDDKIVDLHAMKDPEAGIIVPVWVKCPDCEEDVQNKFVSCVVCSR